MANIEELAAMKELVWGKVIDGSAPEVTGVALDTLKTELLIFSRDPGRTSGLFHGDLENVKIVKVPQDVSRLRRGEVSSGRRFRAEERAPIFTLFPSGPILPAGGEPGSICCFVDRDSGKLGGVTVRHIFPAQRDVEVFLCNDGVGGGMPNCQFLGGSLIQLGDVGLSSDCALFSLDGDGNSVSLQVGELSGGFVEFVNAKSAVNKLVRNFISEQVARVIDVSAKIRYEFLDLRSEVLLEHQILVQGGGRGFGAFGNSGAAIVMERRDSQGGFQRGDILGLYSATEPEDYHYLTPFSVALDALKSKLSSRMVHIPKLGETI